MVCYKSSTNYFLDSRKEWTGQKYIKFCEYIWDLKTDGHIPTGYLYLMVDFDIWGSGLFFILTKTVFKDYCFVSDIWYMEMETTLSSNMETGLSKHMETGPRCH